MKLSKYLLLPCSLLLTTAVSACNYQGIPVSSDSSSEIDASSSESSQSSIDEEVDDGVYTPDSNDETIYFATSDTLANAQYDSSKDEYTFSVANDYRQIYVNAPNKTIIIELKGVTIENSDNSPIFVQDCDDIEISAKNGTVNNVKDTRPIITTDYSSQGKGAIYVNNGDLKLKGAGTLNITANYCNGIHGKDDVKIQKETLNINAVNHAIRGNDSVTITSGTINISCGGDGIHTENSDLTSKGKQQGDVTINGGTITINSWQDAVAASFDAIVEETDSSVPIVLTAKTNKYSSYDGEIVETSNTSLYLKMNSTTYSNGGYTYAAYINEQWYPATYKGTQGNGGPGGGFPGGGPGGSTYYIYELNRPSGASSFTLYRFKGSNVTSYSTTTYNARSDTKAFNSDYDMVQISVNSSVINFSGWSNYSSGNNNSADKSAKGIKAENEIYIKSGTISIETYDDAIHANNDGTIENKDVTPQGNVIISGGTTTLKASDDAVHADGKLTITGGNVNVTSSYEGLEGNVIDISGGTIYVYGTDDGVNAGSGKNTPSITVSGGYLDVEVPTNGDTDGIDSNGAYTQTGGVVIVKGPGSASGGGMAMAAALDTDGAVTISSGSLIVFGAIEKTPSSRVTRTLVASNTVSSGNHTISFNDGTTYSTNLKSSSKGCVVYSSLGTATLS